MLFLKGKSFVGTEVTMDNRGKVYLIVGIIAAVGVLLSVALGAVAGGVAGYFVGREQARAVASVEASERSGVQQGELVIPWVQTPQSPQMPERTPFVRPPVQIPSPGARITDVTPDTPAERAGLRAGDTILAVNDEEVTVAMDLAQIVRKYKPGDTVAIRYSRDDEEKTTVVTLGQHPDDPARPYLGVTYTTTVLPVEPSR
jgi:membrane-associated protease RseP (regulator of RpoE activity)